MKPEDKLSFFQGRQLKTRTFELYEDIFEVTNVPAIGDSEEAERERSFEQSSTVIGKVTYTPDLNTMEIVIGGKLYNFCNVSEKTFDSFEGAGSKGAFFGRSIKGQFDC